MSVLSRVQCVRACESVQGHVCGAYPAVIFAIVFPDRRIAKYCLFTGTCFLHHLAVMFSIPFASSSIV